MLDIRILDLVDAAQYSDPLAKITPRRANPIGRSSVSNDKAFSEVLFKRLHIGRIILWPRPLSRGTQISPLSRFRCESGDKPASREGSVRHLSPWPLVISPPESIDGGRQIVRPIQAGFESYRFSFRQHDSPAIPRWPITSQ